ncbi:hydrolase [Aureococcus anophagefferens]|nr:hydrolase [Aureococcus anophagefferens]
MSALDASKAGAQKKGKPSPEEIARLRAAAAARNRGAQGRGAATAAATKKERDPAAEAAALRGFGVGCASSTAARTCRAATAGETALLDRAALAGVGRVVLTGCDVAGSRSGRDVFAAQCALARDLGKPLWVHVREVDAPGAPLGAYADAIAILGASGLDPRRVCVHCFTGSEAELRAVRNFGARVGFTGFLGIAKRSGATRSAAAALAAAGSRRRPRRRLARDGRPFMLPDKAYVPAALGKQLGLRGGKNEPAVLPAVARALATRSAPTRDVAAATTAAAAAFFAFDAADAAVDGELPVVHARRLRSRPKSAAK